MARTGIPATAGLVVGALLLSALATSPLTILAVFCIGLPMTPIFVIAYLLVDERIDSSRHTEANAWLGSGYNLGSASGAALGGQLLAFTGPRIVAAALAGVAALATVIAQRLPHQPTSAPDTETPSAGNLEKAPSEPGKSPSDATQTG